MQKENGVLKVFPDLHEAEILGERIHLTNQQVTILAMLVKHEGKIVRMTSIINELWGPHNMRDVPKRRSGTGREGGDGHWPSVIYSLVSYVRASVKDVAKIEPARFDGIGCRGSAPADGYRLTYLNKN